jgi:hypothetical protein
MQTGLPWPPACGAVGALSRAPLAVCAARRLARQSRRRGVPAAPHDMHPPSSAPGAPPGLPQDAIIHQVLHKGARPAFPPGTPQAFVNLAAACWAPDPAARPRMGDVVAALQAIAKDLEDMMGAPVPAPAPTPAPAPAPGPALPLPQRAAAAARGA